VAGRVLSLAPGTRPIRVLVADDGVHNRSLLRRSLGDAGFDVREAVNGAEAIAVWEDWRPDAILMDMRMPDVDGLEATRRIRHREASEGAERPSRIVALTASAFDHDRETFLEAGCDQFLGKPFSVDRLFDMLAELLCLDYVTSEAAATEADASRMSLVRLSDIPMKTREELAQSLGIGDIQAALAVIEQIREHDEALGDDLRRMVRAFRLEEIFEALPAG
jgi:CheY-like chemotaxis protein